MSKFITVVTAEGKPARINVEHVLYYRPSAIPKGEGKQGMEPATAIFFVGTDKSMMVRETVEEIDRRINPGYAPTTT
jgi:hypothetical protein